MLLPCGEETSENLCTPPLAPPLHLSTRPWTIESWFMARPTVIWLGLLRPSKPLSLCTTCGGMRLQISKGVPRLVQGSTVAAESWWHQGFGGSAVGSRKKRSLQSKARPSSRGRNPAFYDSLPRKRKELVARICVALARDYVRNGPFVAQDQAAVMVRCSTETRILPD